MIVSWFLVDDNDNPISGMAHGTQIAILQSSSGYLLDWSTGSFSPSGGIEPLNNYTEPLSAVAPGILTKEVSIVSWDDGVYKIYSYYDSGVAAQGQSQYEEIEIKDGEQFTNVKLLGLDQEIVDLLTQLNSKIDDLSDKVHRDAAATLSLEYFSSQDLDGDGLIYGKDFYISVDRPPMLDEIPKAGAPKSWAEYQNEHPEFFT